MTLTIQSPNPKQARMLAARAKHVGFGGARGGGKSWAVRTKAKLLALRYPGIRILIVRRTYPELMNNHIQILRSELAGIARYNDKDKVLRFRELGTEYREQGTGNWEQGTDNRQQATGNRQQGTEYWEPPQGAQQGTGNSQSLPLEGKVDRPKAETDEVAYRKNSKPSSDRHPGSGIPDQGSGNEASRRSSTPCAPGSKHQASLTSQLPTLNSQFSTLNSQFPSPGAGNSQSLPLEGKVDRPKAETDEVAYRKNSKRSSNRHPGSGIPDQGSGNEASRRSGAPCAPGSRHQASLTSQLPTLNSQFSTLNSQFPSPGASSIHFMYCDNDGDLDRLQGVEYDVIFLDEATQLSEYQMKTITACLRGVNDFPKRIYYTCNPGGQGHGYIKRIFIDRRYEAGENPEDYVFIQSLVTDNKALMAAQPDYVRQLEALPEKLRRAWLEGDWDIFEGQFFEDFRSRPDAAGCARLGLDPADAAARGIYTHVIPAFAPPVGWKLYRSFDWGYSRPFSCGWWAVDFDGRLYRILELYGCAGTPNQGLKWAPDRVFAEIRRIETEHPWLAGRSIEGVADPAIWDASGGESIAETAERHRIYFSPGDHKRIPGWMQCHYRLQFDEAGIPMLYVFDTCRAFLRTVPQMTYDQNRPEDLDTALEDHVCDEWRYMCMARPIAPRPPETPGEIVWGNPLGK